MGQDSQVIVRDEELSQKVAALESSVVQALNLAWKQESDLRREVKALREELAKLQAQVNGHCRVGDFCPHNPGA